ncbi:MAG: CBS domain-containing protein [Myxococcota bacterium]
MRVSEVMTAEVVVVDRSASLAECATRLVRLRIRHLPVVGEDGLHGVLTDATVFRRGSFLGESDSHTPASAFVTYDLADEGKVAGDLAEPCEVNCRPDDPLEPVVRRLASGAQDHAVVLDERRHPIGIFTEHDATRLAHGVLSRALTVDHLGERRLLTVLQHTSAVDVYDEMQRRHVRHALVVDGLHQLVAVVSQRDLVMDDVVRRRHVTVDEVVRSRTVYTVPPGSSLVACAEKMLQEGIGSLPVVANGRPVSIVTRRDLVEALATSLENEQLFPDSAPAR